ncbi:hypothetical protein OsJ_13991 [Oryza sativa Japonica Group]|uniref:OSJNBa0096F01.10 protein n=1 Tax=Oryza sativa subsp. japonica TaxID=39947 RepID=Q7XNG3_ORYSJ|nr:hypothetical protein OsJ_13991 [Oryza sativa Japonica Group]CAE04101.3 OSJNBa0096F01.10 [Oryza sativa Japonica Group]
MRSYRTEDWLRKEVAAVMQTVVGSKGKNDDTGRRSRWAMPTAGRSREGVAAHGGGLKESGEANLRELDPACGGAHPMKSMVAIE